MQRSCKCDQSLDHRWRRNIFTKYLSVTAGDQFLHVEYHNHFLGRLYQFFGYSIFFAHSGSHTTRMIRNCVHFGDRSPECSYKVFTRFTLIYWSDTEWISLNFYGQFVASLVSVHKSRWYIVLCLTCENVRLIYQT